MKIARTETNRFRNAGRLQGYKDAGLKGVKVYKAFLDNRTSALCKRLNGQKRALDEAFEDPLTNQKYEVPPSHPNCRCVVAFSAE